VVSSRSEGTSRGKTALNAILKGLGWLVCVFVLLAIGTRRAADVGARDIHFRQGYAVGSVLISLAVAFALWFAVQHAVRKRRGFPPWIGVIAIGVSCLLLLVDVGQRGVGDAEADAGTETCVPAAKAYGSPPIGWTYTKADPGQRARIGEVTKLASDPSVDISLATRGDAAVAVFAVPDGVESVVAGVESGAKNAGATLTRAPSGATVIDYPDIARRVVVGIRDCNAIVVDGSRSEDVDTVTGAIFR
jgi:hypothetical protein